MLYNQHKFVGDSIYIGKNVSLPARSRARGRIVFSQKEAIEYTSKKFIRELMKYNKALKGLNINKLRYKVEKDALVAYVRRTFGDINGWAGDHSKLYPPDGKAKKFDDLKVRLQVVANTHDFDYYSLALGNWDHFMPMSYNIWKAFHSSALRLARKYAASKKKGAAFKQDVDSNGRTKAIIFDLGKTDLAKALFLEGYACHFLEDCFVAGHIRTPRLLFGADMDSLRSKFMHDEDNKIRLKGCPKNGTPFRLIGEGARRDDFSNKTKLKNDKNMKLLLDKVVDTVSSSVQQVFDIAYSSRPRKEITLAEIGNKIPQVDIYWRTLPQKRSRTHALEISPKKSGKTTKKPLYKFHADYDGKKKKFKNPIIVKRSSSSKWRRVWLSLDVDWFTPGKGLAKWIPADPTKKKTIP